MLQLMHKDFSAQISTIAYNQVPSHIAELNGTLYCEQISHGLTWQDTIQTRVYLSREYETLATVPLRCNNYII